MPGRLDSNKESPPSTAPQPRIYEIRGAEGNDSPWFQILPYRHHRILGPIRFASRIRSYAGHYTRTTCQYSTDRRCSSCENCGGTQVAMRAAITVRRAHRAL